MEKISSRQTFFFKYVFPLIWLCISLPGLTAWVAFQTTREAMFQNLGFAALFVLLPFVVSGLIEWRMVDEVWDGGEFLLFKKGKRQVNIPLKKIESISSSFLVRPAFVTLGLREAYVFGRSICFIPRDSWGMASFEECRVVIDLKERVSPNQSPNPTLSSVTPPARQESRHP
jgi:hypothetical protein